MIVNERFHYLIFVLSIVILPIYFRHPLVYCYSMVRLSLHLLRRLQVLTTCFWLFVPDVFCHSFTVRVPLCFYLQYPFLNALYLLMCPRFFPGLSPVILRSTFISLVSSIPLVVEVLGQVIIHHPYVCFSILYL